MKKIFSALLAVIIFASMFATTTFADDSTQQEIDLSEYDNDALIELFEQVKAELDARHIDYEETADVIKSQEYDYGDGDTISISLSRDDDDKLTLLSIGLVKETNKASLAFLSLLSVMSEAEKKWEDEDIQDKYEISISVFSDGGVITYAGGRIAGTNTDGTPALNLAPDWLIVDEDEYTLEPEVINTYMSDVLSFVTDFMSDLQN